MPSIEIPATEIEPSLIEIEISSPSHTVEETYDIEIHPLQYTITNDNIFLIEQYGDIPDWLDDMINNTINSNPINQDLQDLMNYVNNLEDGFTNRIDYIETEQGKQLSHINAIKLSSDINAAAVANLDIVKITSTQATAISRDTVIAWSTDGSGGAWFDEIIRADRTAIQANAYAISSLVAVSNTNGTEISDINNSINELKKQNDGVIETLYYDSSDVGLNGPVDANGCLIETLEPYATWKSEGTLAPHTADAYVLFEKVAGTKNFLRSWKFSKVDSLIGTCQVDENGYGWLEIIDTDSAKAYQMALNAKNIADGKSRFIRSSTQPTCPIDETTNKVYETSACVGDIWYNDEILRVLVSGYVGDTNNGSIQFTGNDNELYTWLYTVDKTMEIRINEIASVTSGQFTVWESRYVYEDGSIHSSVRYYKDGEGNDLPTDGPVIGMVRIVAQESRVFEGELNQTDSNGVKYDLEVVDKKYYQDLDTGVGSRIYNQVWQYTGNTALGEDGWVLQENSSLSGTFASMGKLIVDDDGSLTGWSAIDGSNSKSTFQINADKFQIKSSSVSSPVIPFQVNSSNNGNSIVINADMLIDGTIESSDYDFTNSKNITGFSMRSNDGSSYNIYGGGIVGSNIKSGYFYSENFSWNGVGNPVTGFMLSHDGSSTANNNGGEFKNPHGYNIVGGKIYGAEIASPKFVDINSASKPFYPTFRKDVQVVLNSQYSNAVDCKMYVYAYNSPRDTEFRAETSYISHGDFSLKNRIEDIPIFMFSSQSGNTSFPNAYFGFQMIRGDSESQYWSHNDIRAGDAYRVEKLREVDFNNYTLKVYYFKEDNIKFHTRVKDSDGHIVIEVFIDSFSINNFSSTGNSYNDYMKLRMYCSEGDGTPYFRTDMHFFENSVIEKYHKPALFYKDH